MELELDLLKERKKSLFRVVLGVFLFLITIGAIIIKILEGKYDWLLIVSFALLALSGIIHFVEGLGFPFESLFGKAYVLINDGFISLKAGVFEKKQFINWNKIQLIDYKLNKFIIQNQDNTILIIDLSKFEYIVNMEIKKVIIGIAKEKNIQSNISTFEIKNDFARRAFISIENKITNKHEYAVGVSYQ